MTSPFTYIEHAAAFDPGIVAALWSVTTTSDERTSGIVPYRVLPDGCLDLVLRVRPDEPNSVADPDVIVGGPARTASLVAVLACP